MYDDAAAWAAGPEKVYSLLAQAAIDLIPSDLDGRAVLDAGAGTGAAGRILAARGARVLSIDVSEPMVRRAPGDRCVADIRRLPLRGDAVSVSIACLVLSHVDDPVRAAGELVRVTAPGGIVVITAFPAGAGHPVKAAADRVLAVAGYREPDWYRSLKGAGEGAVGSVGALASLGLPDARVTALKVDLGGLTPDELVAWRLGMAPVAAWLSTRNGESERLAGDIKALLPETVDPLSLLVLTARK